MNIPDDFNITIITITWLLAVTWLTFSAFKFERIISFLNGYYGINSLWEPRKSSTNTVIMILAVTILLSVLSIHSMQSNFNRIQIADQSSSIEPMRLCCPCRSRPLRGVHQRLRPPTTAAGRRWLYDSQRGSLLDLRNLHRCRLRSRKR